MLYYSFLKTPYIEVCCFFGSVYNKSFNALTIKNMGKSSGISSITRYYFLYQGFRKTLPLMRIRFFFFLMQEINSVLWSTLKITKPRIDYHQLYHFLENSQFCLFRRC